jgi:hypothetical protein
VVEVEVSALKPLPEAPAVSARDAMPPSEGAAVTASPHRGGGRRTLGVALGGGGVVALGTGLVFGAMARSSWNDALAHCDAERACDDQGLALEQTARERATLSTVLVSAGLAAAAAGTFLYLTAPRTRAVVAPTTAGDGATVTLLGSF